MLPANKNQIAADKRRLTQIPDPFNPRSFAFIGGWNPVLPCGTVFNGIATSINLTVVALVVLPSALWAQWPSFHAPALKTPDGHPDLSGIWDRGMPPAPGPRPFQNLPSLLPDGLPMQPWAVELRKQRLAENSKDHPDAHCLPLHPVQLHSHPQPRKIVQTPGLVLIVYEANNGLRQIFTDGRPLPGNDPQPWWFGYSIGKWEGDTLVVQTTGFRDTIGWLDEEGTPVTSTARMTERFRRLNH